MIMNKYLKNGRKHVLDYLVKTEEKEKTIDGLRKKYSNGDLAKNAYEIQIEELKVSNDMKATSIRSIMDVKESYQNELAEWAALNAKDLTDDIKIFNSPIDLKAEDYERLETKYQCNYSMLKAIKDHAKKNEVAYSSKYSIDKKEKLRVFNDFVRSATNIVEATKIGESKSYTGALWDKEEAFNKLYAGLSRVIQTNEGDRRLVHSDGSISWG